MKQYVPAVPATPVFNRVTDWVSHAVDAALNRVFSLTHRVAAARSRAVTVGFLLIWGVSVLTVVTTGFISDRVVDVARAAVNFAAAPQDLTNAIMRLLFTTVLHPVVLGHLLALYAPYWLLHRITAIYLADIFEKDEPVAQKFIMQAAFGTGYSTIHIRQGKVADEDRDSIIMQIGGPGNVFVELDSAVLFERPDGTPHVIEPTSETVIDAFERLRRVVDLRDSIESADLGSTRSKDGMLVGAKDIQFSYSIYRGETPDRKLTPYPFSKKAVESLVYKDSRTVKPGIAPARTPEWQLAPFKMGGAIMGEMGGFISKRGLSEFLASIGEPEETSWTNREQQIDKQSQLLSGLNGNRTGDSPLKAGPVSSRTFLTSLFYKQDDFQDRMAKKGFQLNWIGVGTWNTPDVVPANHREAWKISRENMARGNPVALKGLQAEAKLQEMLRLIQSVPIGRFYSDPHEEEEKLVDGVLFEYEKILQRATDLYLRGTKALDARYTKLTKQALVLFERIGNSSFPDYDNFLQGLALISDQANYVFDYTFEEYLKQALELYDTLKSVLDPDDLEFLQEAIRLYNDIKDYNQIRRVIEAITNIRRPQHQI